MRLSSDPRPATTERPPPRRRSGTPTATKDPRTTTRAPGRWLGSARVWAVATLVFVAFAGVFFASPAPFSIPTVENACGDAPLDVRAFSTSGDVTDFLDACGTEGRRHYRNMLLADVFYPVVFGVFMASSLVLVLSRLGVPRRSVAIVAAVPFAAMTFDHLENTFALLALDSHPDPAATSALLGYMSAAKTASSWAAGTILVVATVILSIRCLARLRRRVHHGERRSQHRYGTDLSAPGAGRHSTTSQ